MAVYTDINLLFTKHPVTADVVKNNDESAIKASVMNLILTKNYERPFHPEIGCQAHAVLFENFSPVTTNLLEQTIRDVINKFEPRCTVKNIKIRERPDDNEIEIEIEIIINSTDRLVKIITALSRTR